MKQRPVKILSNFANPSKKGEQKNHRNFGGLMICIDYQILILSSGFL